MAWDGWHGGADSFCYNPRGAGSSVWWYTYNGAVEPFSVKGIWDTYRDKEVNQELLLSYGYGDGGGGVNRDMLEMRRRLEHMPGLPKVVTGRVDEYFEQLQETVNASDSYVHTWDGELYLEYHRGTYTSQAYNKRMNRKLELLYREAEWLQVLQAVAGADWSQYREGLDLYEGWKMVSGISSTTLFQAPQSLRCMKIHESSMRRPSGLVGMSSIRQPADLYPLTRLRRRLRCGTVLLLPKKNLSSSLRMR